MLAPRRFLCKLRVAEPQVHGRAACAMGTPTCLRLISQLRMKALPCWPCPALRSNGRACLHGTVLFLTQQTSGGAAQFEQDPPLRFGSNRRSRQGDGRPARLKRFSRNVSEARTSQNKCPRDPDGILHKIGGAYVPWRMHAHGLPTRITVNSRHGCVWAKRTRLIPHPNKSGATTQRAELSAQRQGTVIGPRQCS